VESGKSRSISVDIESLEVDVIDVVASLVVTRIVLDIGENPTFNKKIDAL